MTIEQVTEEDVLADRINAVATSVGRSPIDVLATMATAVIVSAALAGPQDA